MSDFTGSVGDLLLDEAARRKPRQFTSADVNDPSGDRIAHRAWIPDLTEDQEADPEQFAELVKPIYFFGTPPIRKGDPESPHWKPIYEVNTRWKKLRGSSLLPPYYIRNVTVQASRTVHYDDGTWKTIPSTDPILEHFTDTDMDGNERPCRPQQMVAAAIVDDSGRPALLPFTVSDFKSFRAWLSDALEDYDGFELPGAAMKVWNSGKGRGKTLRIRWAKKEPNIDMSEYTPVDIGHYAKAVRSRFVEWAADQGVTLPAPVADETAEPADPVIEQMSKMKPKAETVDWDSLSYDELRSRADEAGLRYTSKTTQRRLITMLKALSD